MKNKKQVSNKKRKININKDKIKEFFKKNYFNFFKEFPIILVFIITTLANTILLRLLTIHKISNPKPIIIDFAILFIISSFIPLFKKNKSKIRYIMFWSIFTAILCIIHAIYYTYYSSFASISLLATSTFVVDVGDAVVENVMKVEDFIFIFSPIILYYYYRKKIKNKEIKKLTKEEKKYSFVNLLSTGAILLLISSFTITKTEWGRFVKMWNRESVVSSFGLYVYQGNDIVQSIQPKINNLFGHDKAYKNVKEYYEENPYQKENNEYTGIFEGKNIIVIHAESLQTIAMKQSFNGVEVTPNINKLAKEGLFFSNYYSQVGVGTSSDAEFTFSTSLMPSSSGTVFVNYFDRQYDTIQKRFKEKNYYVFSMHANNGDFWNRQTMHENMGYDKFYSKSSYEIDETIGLGLSDKSFFKQSVEKLKTIDEEHDEPYYGTLITLTNHTPFSDTELMDEYPTTWTVNINGSDVTRDYINDTTLGNYFRSVHYFDQAIGQFITDMDEAGLLENTVIAIYGDHDARISKKYYNILYNYDPYEDKERKEGDPGYIDYNDYMYKLDRKVPFIIWSKDKKLSKEITTATGMINAFPILGNMFNVHSDYQIGKDTTQLKDNTVVFSDGSYVTNKIYYNNQNGEFYSINGDAVDEEYINSNSDYANKIIEVSNNIITYDLIKEIENKTSDN